LTLGVREAWWGLLHGWGRWQFPSQETVPPRELGLLTAPTSKGMAAEHTTAGPSKHAPSLITKQAPAPEQDVFGSDSRC
jgi:hypothetical protein